MVELWKDIQGYEGLYQVSNLGNVKSLNWRNSNKAKLLSLLFYGKEPKHHYYRVKLTKDKKPKEYMVHRLVADAFIPNPDNKPQVNHIDGNKTNNQVDNLEWVTASENQQHAVKFGLRNSSSARKGASNSMARAIDQYDLNGNFIKSWGCITEAANALKISISGISDCARGRRDKCRGYIWRFTNKKHMSKRNYR